ncbi:hypothetical protein [Streptomyces zaomyceticus]|uniref:hypothetical protein n=1 Tax=Streptomyces zaomyceticus TaxID=68286 RepID=UPI00339DF8CD
MSDWGIALIAAGSAILGSSVTGFFAWKAGHRQAAAAESAGQAQAAALISTVQATLDEQQRARVDERRRMTYAAVLTAATDYHVSEDSQDGARLLSAISAVEVEGPPEVAACALSYGRAVTSEIGQPADVARDRALRVEAATSDPDLEIRTRANYISAVRRALDQT